ncbi:glycosyltransferase family 9 protein [Tautonia rosea]|uniref:glycosyltransferase family 9 protein n=1 Tax=Tautonia rosea TaxID=2728037 RepID=UPI0014760137|nr:glycosyltransferase family 9 protein [Tautonia rosea]
MPAAPSIDELRNLSPRRVCLIKPSALGDVIHALPVLATLRDRWPSAHFSWVINRGLVGLVEGNPALDDVIPFDRARAGLGPRGLATTSRLFVDLRRRGFDVTIDLQGLFRSGLMTFATAAPVRIGRADAREGASVFYTHQVASDATHAVDRLLDVALALGAERVLPRFNLAIREEDRQWAETALAGVPRPLLVLNPGARWLTKRWPPRHFAEVARRAVARFGVGLVVVGAAEDRPLSTSIRRELEPLGIPVRDLTGQTSLMGLAAVMAKADLVLSNDTGPLHLAVASGARVIAIFTCTDPAKTGPYGPGAQVVRTGVWCAASCVRRCDRMECMTELSPDRVWQVVSRTLIEERREVA